MPEVVDVVEAEVELDSEVEVVELVWNVVVDKLVEEVVFDVHAVTSNVIIRIIGNVKTLIILLFSMYHSNKAITAHISLIKHFYRLYLCLNISLVILADIVKWPEEIP